MPATRYGFFSLRRIAARCGGIVMASLWCASAAAGEPSALAGARPNIVLIMPDDMGYADLACHGNPVIHTPHLDGLAADSLRFSDFHASPTCAPTRAALMTGRHEFKSGVTHTIDERERLALDAVTIAQVLQRAGYATGVFGKWHLGDEDAYQPNRRGFDEAFIHGAGGIGQSYPGSCGDAPGNEYFDPVIRRNGEFVRTKGYCTDVFFNEAIEWIDRVRTEPRPFFAYITPNAPHQPLISPGAEYDRLYQGKAIDGQPLNEKDAAYYAMISNVDDNVGRLLRRLDEWKLAEETLVIFFTDNGGTHPHLFSGGFRGRKGTVYHGGTHIPSFWRWPGKIPAGVDCPALAAHLDVFRTLAELAGAELTDAEERQAEGRSLLALLENPTADWPDRTLVTHLGRWPRGQAAASKYEQCSIRNRRFRLVNNAELYDLERDPGETTNAIAEHPAVAAELRAEYDWWWNAVQPLLVNETAVGPPVNPYREAYEQQLSERGIR